MLGFVLNIMFFFNPQKERGFEKKKIRDKVKIVRFYIESDVN